MALVGLLMGAVRLVAQQAADAGFAALPDAPQSQVEPKAAAPGASDKQPAAPAKGCKPARQAAGGASAVGVSDTQKNAASPCTAKFDFFYPLGKPPRNGPLTSKDKLRIAASDVVDPFNLITIGATAAITIGSNPHTGYGPGMAGWAKNSATLLTEDMTGAFFITYFIPSLTGQDPRYYRMPEASVPRRIVNAVVQPVWTRSDKGNHMPNYGMLIGIPAAVTLANVYVPGRKQGFWPTAESSAIAIASAPADNLITEFLPDVAKHVSIHIFLIQKIVNHITLTDGQS